MVGPTRGDGVAGRDHRLRRRALARQRHRQWLRQRPGQRAERRRRRPRPGSRRRSVGWLGIGALNYPLAKLVGREPLPEVPQQGWTRYFRFTTDHKVVGMQYVIGVITFLFTGGLLAMAIRTELLSPTNHFFGPGTYIRSSASTARS
jgi:hypothetical protein